MRSRVRLNGSTSVDHSWPGPTRTVDWQRTYEDGSIEDGSMFLLFDGERFRSDFNVTRLHHEPAKVSFGVEGEPGFEVRVFDSLTSSTGTGAPP